MNIAVYGLGLMGASIGLALRGKKDYRITGFARRQSTCDDALESGVVDAASTDPVEAAKDADLLVFCTPIRTLPALIESSLPGVKPGALLTDVGSTKSWLAAEVGKVLPAGVRFIGSHPMCGSEKTGLDAGRADLYHGACVIVTEEDPALRKFWSDTGARLLVLDADTHDALVARASHLPHLLAALLVNTSLRDPIPEALPGIISTGFLDTSRIASGSPSLWADIVATNREAILAECVAARAHLDELIQVLEGPSADAREFLAGAKSKRDRCVNHRLGR